MPENHLRAFAMRAVVLCEQSTIRSHVVIKEQQDLTSGDCSASVPCSRRSPMRLFDDHQRERQFQRLQRSDSIVVRAVDHRDDVEVSKLLLTQRCDEPHNEVATCACRHDHREARCRGQIGSRHRWSTTTSPSEPDTGIGRSPSTPGSTSKNPATIRPSWIWLRALSTTSIL